MKSAVQDILPPQIRRSLMKFGTDLSIARRKRRLTVAMMCERLGVSKSTWQRMEKGDPSVAMVTVTATISGTEIPGKLFVEVEVTRHPQAGGCRKTKAKD